MAKANLDYGDLLPAGLIHGWLTNTMRKSRQNMRCTLLRTLELGAGSNESQQSNEGCTSLEKFPVWSASRLFFSETFGISPEAQQVFLSAKTHFANLLWASMNIKLEHECPSLRNSQVG